MKSVLFVSVVFMLCFMGSVRTAGVSSDIAVTFDRVLIVLLENQPLRLSLKNPMMQDVIKQGTLLYNYYGLVNPSQPNYIGLLAGDVMGVDGDGVFDIDARNLVDQFEEKGVSWKSYQEDYPGDCFAGDVGTYRRKHNPFISFNNIRNDPARCAKIVNADEFAADLAAGTVPQYSFYTPNMDNNGHDTGLDYAARWLHQTFLPRYLDEFNKTGNALMVITFDEGVIGENQIYTLLIGEGIPAGHVDHAAWYDHYSLLKMVQDNWQLGSLGRHDSRAQPITNQHWIEGAPNVPPAPVPYATLLGIMLPGVAVVSAASVGLLIYVRRRRNQQRMAVGSSILSKEIA